MKRYNNKFITDTYAPYTNPYNLNLLRDRGDIDESEMFQPSMKYHEPFMESFDLRESFDTAAIISSMGPDDFETFEDYEMFLTLMDPNTYDDPQVYEDFVNVFNPRAYESFEMFVRAMEEFAAWGDGGYNRKERGIGSWFKKAAQSVSSAVTKAANTVASTVTKAANTVASTTVKAANTVASTTVKAANTVASTVNNKVIQPVVQVAKKICRMVDNVGPQRTCANNVTVGGALVPLVSSDPDKPVTVDTRSIHNNSNKAYATSITCASGKEDCSASYTYSGTFTNDDKDLKFEYRTPNPQFTQANDTGFYCDNPAMCSEDGKGDYVKDMKMKTGRYVVEYPSYQSILNGNITTRSYNPANPNDSNYKYNYLYLKQNVPIQQIRYEFEGEFGNKATANPSASDCDPKTVKHAFTNTKDVVRRNANIIWTYHVESDINYFCDEVFADWVYLIQKQGALKLILNELRDFIMNNPELILINKVNTQMGTYFRSFNNVEVGMIDIPLGAPFINIPNSYVVPLKGYHADFKVDNTIDPKNIKYDKNLKHNDIVNAIAPDTKKATYKPINYLDNIYTTMNGLCKLTKCITPDIALGISIPARGSQLFEAIGEYKDVSTGHRINKGTDLVSFMEVSSVKDKPPEDNVNPNADKAASAIENGKTLTDKGNTVLPRVIMRVGKPLDDLLVDAYTLVSKDMGIHAPIINVKQVENSYINISINTSNEDKDNEVYLYVAKPDRALGSYVAKGKSSENSKTKTLMHILNIDYDGNETKETPVVLMKRF